MATLKIAIPDELQNWIDHQVESALFANASDYIGELIRSHKAEVEAIRLALVEGEISGESELSVSDIIKQQKKPTGNN
ncbi:type II toxin-antitoxin system ParD family antitoxin [Aliiglaciecola sp. CAU 1673]|uniref:ribbon-helix-helix domain-containing protein n=1 Tax=Aliiglaciecola sp. CAU 1673 TaxID=3032595 RepID=UPI0023DBB049|nr:type II toxin-antitoxin system ParD family antitoxin [Aliiglaciecola sp. CAU 1673]MDF2180133.1 type II toxin-antitoxin system ParD family antitoxin [Aliiglaciecola sp. CAU 1673]